MGYFSFWVAPFHHIIAINKQDEFKALIEGIALVLPDYNPRNFTRNSWWCFIYSQSEHSSLKHNPLQHHIQEQGKWRFIWLLHIDIFFIHIAGFR